MKEKKLSPQQLGSLRSHAQGLWRQRPQDIETMIHRTPRSYVIPMVARTLDITERLQEEAGLTVDDLRHLTGYSRSTIYRILRTLDTFGYIDRGPQGHYRLNTHKSVSLKLE